MKIQSYYSRICLNAPIQGGAADIVSSAQLLVEKDPILKALEFNLLLQIHDEICGTCPKKYSNLVLDRVINIMENCLDKKYPINLKVNGDCGETYADAK